MNDGKSENGVNGKPGADGRANAGGAPARGEYAGDGMVAAFGNAGFP